MSRIPVLVLLATASIAVACPGAEALTRVAGVEVRGSAAIRQSAMKLGFARELGQSLTDQVVARGVERLKRIGRAAGVRVDFRETPSGTWICYEVRENPAIESIEFQGNTAISDAELLKDFAVKPGEVLDWDRLYKEVNRIPEIYLARKGVLYAGVLSPLAVQANGGKVSIYVQEFRLRRLEVKGVRGHLRDAVLASLPLRRGQVLRRQDLLGGLFNAYQLPGIQDIEYSPKFDREHGEITLVLNLTEAGQPAASPAGRGKLN